MNFLHSEHTLEVGDSVQVVLNGPANVLLMDAANFEKYKAGQVYHYYGGHAQTSPARLVAPRAGQWHVVINLGGFPGTIKAGVSVSKSRVEAV